MAIRWNTEKNDILKREDVAELIRTGGELDIIPHPSRPNQRIIVVRINGYVHAVPFVEDADGLFLKTIYPSRDLNNTEAKDEEEGACS